MVNKPNESDEVLLQKSAAGDRLAFRRLMEKYATPVYNYLCHLLKDAALAEDISQDVFIKVYINASRWRPRAQVKTWIFRIARNAALNELKAARHRTVTPDNQEAAAHPSPVEMFPAAGADPLTALLKNEQSGAIAAALKELPENQRSALLLHRFEEMSYVEIARVMGLSVSAVESLLFRARQNLKIRLRDYYDR